MLLWIYSSLLLCLNGDDLAVAKSSFEKLRRFALREAVNTSVSRATKDRPPERYARYMREERLPADFLVEWEEPFSREGHF